MPRPNRKLFQYHCGCISRSFHGEGKRKLTESSREFPKASLDEASVGRSGGAGASSPGTPSFLTFRTQFNIE